jgi:hypothetical protein
MKVFKSARLALGGALLSVLAICAFAGPASAAVTQLTLDPSAALSPGHLHAYLTGTITCDVGDSVSLSGQVAQPKGASGWGYMTAPPVCQGTPQPYTVDVGGGAFPFPGSTSGVFKAGKASAQVTASVCDPFPFPGGGCSSTSTDAMIRLTK